MKKLLPWKQNDNRWERIEEETNKVIGFVLKDKMCYNCFVYKKKPEIEVRDYFISCRAGMDWVDEILLAQGFKENNE